MTRAQKAIIINPSRSSRTSPEYLRSTSLLLSMVVVMSFVHVLESQFLMGSVKVSEWSVGMQMLMSSGQMPPLVPFSR
jgi:hypothetical protein